MKTAWLLLVALGSAALCAMPFAHSAVQAVILATVSIGGTAIGMGGWGVNHLDVAPRYAGVLMGISNTFATVPGIIGVAATGFIVQATGSYSVAFYLAAAIYLVGLIAFNVWGSGERKTLRLVARYADACNLFAPEPSVVAHKLEVLARHCDAEGRDPASIDRTILAMSNPLDDLDGFLALMAHYSAMGIDAVELMPVGDPVAYVSEVGDRVVPALATLGP